MILFLAAGTADAGPIVFDGGAPDLLDGNEMTLWLQAEDFQLSSDVTIFDAHFWTGEDPDFPGGTFEPFEGSPWDGTLEWFFFSDVAGAPAAEIASGNGANVQKMPTGNTYFPVDRLPEHFLTEYEYWFDLDTPVSLLEGVTYWFGLHLASDYLDRDEIYWETTSGGFGMTGHETIGLPCDSPIDNWCDTEQHHAFNLTTAPEPSTLLLLGTGLAAVGVRRYRRKQ